MKILIIKTFPKEIKTHHLTYNVQELGLAVALRKRGHDADVLCCSDDGNDRESVVEQDGKRVIVYARKAYKILKNGWFRNIDNLLREYDILQTEEYNQMYTWHLAKHYPQKTIVYHGPYYSDFNKNYNLMAGIFDIFFLNRYKKYGTAFLAKSRLAEEYLRGKGLTNVDSIGVGLNSAFLTNDNKTNSISGQIRLLKNYQSLKLLYIGLLEERRNSTFLLDVMTKIKEQEESPKLVIVGKYSNKAYAERFKEHVLACGLEGDIIHVEQMEQNQLAYVYNACDFFLFPTQYDIYGMVLLEAMYFGLPVISTINGGSDMMIRNGKNGMIIDECNANKWAEIILSLNGNKELRHIIGQTASQTISKHFTWDALAEKFISKYQTKLRG